MSKISPSKLSIEDFPEQRSWIGKLFEVLNQFSGELNTSFQNALTIQDNLFQEIKELKFKYSTDQLPIKFRAKFGTSPQGILPIYLYDTTSNVYGPAAPWPVWSYADGQVSIASIVGLTSNHNYVMRLLIIYG